MLLFARENYFTLNLIANKQDDFLQTKKNCIQITFSGKNVTFSLYG